MNNGWIGLTDQWQEGTWQTPVKGKVPYTNWGQGEPNNLGDEDCTHLRNDGKWNDLKCSSQQAFLCQFAKGEGNDIKLIQCTIEYIENDQSASSEKQLAVHESDGSFHSD